MRPLIIWILAQRQYILHHLAVLQVYRCVIKFKPVANATEDWAKVSRVERELESLGVTNV